MSLCQDCTYTEIENKAGGTIKSYIKTAECSTCQTARETQTTTEATQAPYVYPDPTQIKLDIKTAFAGSLGSLGGIFAIVSSYIDGRNWSGLKDILDDLVTETSITSEQRTTFKGVLNNATHNIDLDDIPAGV